MRLIPKKYKFAKLANVNAEGKPTSLQTGRLAQFGEIVVYAYSDEAANEKAAKKCGVIFKAIRIQ